MKKVFKGNKYNFQIFNFPLGKRQILFSIEATHNRTKRTSFITNVNVILSELNIHSEIPKFWESEWILNNTEANKLITVTEQFLSDKKFLPYLEKYLNLDRKQSEWENYEQL
ncbi:MAG: hypothetical protein L6275_00120 [Candidatus Portnoybacteria bacterium]|nr:hypothetical protein [Candidatus Portnoybacteria bacterium]